MSPIHHIVFVTGLFSSFPILGFFFQLWAKRAAARLEEALAALNINNFKILIVSADLKGEAKAVRQILDAKALGILGQVHICGHSNGFRDGLIMAELLGTDHSIPTEIFVGIDMTKAPRDAKATSHIGTFDEFHGPLNHADVSEYPEDRHNYVKLGGGHTAIASKEIVQHTITHEISNSIRQFEEERESNGQS